MSGVTVIICGLLRGFNALALSLQPLLTLRGRGQIDRIIMSTWNAEVSKNPREAKLLKNCGVEIIGSDFPQELDRPSGVFHQMLSLDRGLDYVDCDSLVLKTRADVVFGDIETLEAVISQDLTIGKQYFSLDCNQILSKRIWTPNFLPMFPFFMADLVFLGVARDLRKLCNYEMMVEAYQIKGRPEQSQPHRGVCGAPEIRRYLGPFLNMFPMFREYQNVWPRHCIATDITGRVIVYNYCSELYREYMAVFFAMVVRYFRIGDLHSNANIYLVKEEDDNSYVSIRWPLSIPDATSANLSDRLSFPSGNTLITCYGSRWIDEVFENPGRDPYAEELIVKPLARAENYKWDRPRRERFDEYMRGLCSITD
jgi:hypothetical protein